jgi:E3 ubiquitin-protein ligase DOA10
MMQYFEKNEIPDKKMPHDIDLEGCCRICLGEEDDALLNPLFSPCKCAGSMGLIHLECLREWLKSKKI